MADADHDRIIRLEERLAALDRLLGERDGRIADSIDQAERAFPTREDLSEKIASIRNDMISREDHERLLSRMSSVESALAGATGTSTGTMRIFLVAAVVVSLAGLIFTVVHLISP